MDENLRQFIRKRKEDTVFLLKSNSRSEDVLDYPYRLLMMLGLELERIIDLDDTKSTEKTIRFKNRGKRRLCLISSAHFLLSSNTIKKGSLKQSKWTDYKIHDFFSLLETIRILKPERFLWFPHDLLEPFKKEDLPFLSVADCVFVPLNSMVSSIKSYIKNLKVAGWPRIHQDLDFSVKYELVWFITYFQKIQEKMKPESFANLVKPLIEYGVLFKFPGWTNTLPYEEAIQKIGGKCINVKDTSLEIIAQTKIPIITAGSSLELEASLIKKPYIRFHFPLFIFKPPSEKTVADCYNFYELTESIENIKKNNFLNATDCIDYFNSNIFLQEALKDYQDSN